MVLIEFFFSLSMADFRIGVVGGAGGQGKSWIKRFTSWKHLKGKNLKVVAVCDRNELGLAKVAKTYNLTPYTDYIEMYEKEKLDVVVIATPHYLHAPMSIAAAEHGINVLVEKVMCIDLKQADAMKAAVEKAGIKLAVGFQKRYDPKYVIMRNAVRSGDLGDIYQINCITHWWRTEKYYLNSSPAEINKDEDWEGWRGHWKSEGAGALANQMIHFIDAFQWIAPSPIKSIMAAGRIAKHEYVETDDNTNAIVEFEDGSMGLLQLGVAYERNRKEDFAIYGTKGNLTSAKNIRGKWGRPKLFEDQRNPLVKSVKPLISYANTKFNGSKSLFANLMEAIEKDDASIISVGVDEGRKSVELMRGMLLSAKSGKKITFPFDDPAGEYPDLLRTYKN